MKLGAHNLGVKEGSSWAVPDFDLAHSQSAFNPLCEIRSNSQ